LRKFSSLSHDDDRCSIPYWYCISRKRKVWIFRTFFACVDIKINLYHTLRVEERRSVTSCFFLKFLKLKIRSDEVNFEQINYTKLCKIPSFTHQFWIYRSETTVLRVTMATLVCELRNLSYHRSVWPSRLMVLDTILETKINPFPFMNYVIIKCLI